MAYDARVLKVFIASPGDTELERDAVADELLRWNDARAEREKIMLAPWRWELHSVPEVGGSAQSAIDRQALDKCDVVIALFKTRLGTATDDAVSGTAHEILRAHQAGKPVHVYFSKESLPNDIDIAELQRLHKFRNELEGLIGQYDNVNNLRSKVNHAIERDLEKFALIRDAGTTEVSQRAPSPCDYELIEIHHKYRVNPDNSEFLDMEYSAHRRVRCNHPAGYPRQAMVWSKPSDRLPPFDPRNPPSIQLSSYERSLSGSAELVYPPRKCSGSSFTIDVKMDPPLKVGETIDFYAEGGFPKYRFATAASMRKATRGDTNLGERDFDYFAWTVSHPTKLLKITIDLPTIAGIKALGPRSSLSNVDLPAVSGPAVDLNEEYHCSEIVESGSSYTRLELTVKDAWQSCRYRLAWRLP